MNDIILLQNKGIKIVGINNGLVASAASLVYF